jgi:hypothetical protein
VPPAILSLKAHLGTGDPLAWRAALRVLEHAIGRPNEAPEELTPAGDDPLNIAGMSAARRRELLASVLEQHPHLRELVPANGERLLAAAPLPPSRVLAS